MPPFEEMQELQGSPPWFDELDPEAVASQLNGLLQRWLLERMPDGVGAEIATRMVVTQIDSYHEGRPETRPELEGGLAEINRNLNDRLRQILVEEYGAPPEDVQFAVVRWWACEAGAENPACEYHKCWDTQKRSFCTWCECCPCA